MTVRADLERSIAIAESAQGTYLLFAVDSEDDRAKQVFQDMAEDMQRHVQILQSRIDYLNQYNQLNGDQGDDQQNKKNKKQNKEKNGQQNEEDN